VLRDQDIPVYAGHTFRRSVETKLDSRIPGLRHRVFGSFHLFEALKQASLVVFFCTNSNDDFGAEVND
jgi:hypothetical protein